MTGYVMATSSIAGTGRDVGNGHTVTQKRSIPLGGHHLLPQDVVAEPHLKFDLVACHTFTWVQLSRSSAGGCWDRVVELESEIVHRLRGTLTK
jgi:hypothetical protein